MRLSDLDGFRVCLLGFGREGQSTLRAVRKHAPRATVVVADREAPADAPGCELRVGDAYLSGLDDCDWIVKSPGIAPCAQLDQVSSKLTSATDLFLWTARDLGARILGVTGSKGKSTTSSLLYSILCQAGYPVQLVGNIGLPALDYLDAASPGSYFVTEMSSYQLMSVTTSPSVAIVTSFFPEHLDYHGSLEAYWSAKANIARFQQPDDCVFYNSRFEECRNMAKLSAGLQVAYSAADCPVPIQETHLLGAHNADNVAAAHSAARFLGIDASTSIAAIQAFRGLPHRLQSLGVTDTIEWVDDAISTTPESTIAALDALGDRVGTLILGGQDRGYQFEGLARRIADSSVSTVILFPGSGARIAEAIRKIGDSRGVIQLFHAADMSAAVQTARRETRPGAICLLSTASPSYGMFRNFEEKGAEFARWVHLAAADGT